MRLQFYKDGGVADVKTLTLAGGLSRTASAARTHTRSADERAEWMGNRAGAGRMAPKGFPRSGKF